MQVSFLYINFLNEDVCKILVCNLVFVCLYHITLLSLLYTQSYDSSLHIHMSSDYRIQYNKLLLCLNSACSTKPALAVAASVTPSNFHNLQAHHNVSIGIIAAIVQHGIDN